MRLIPTVNPIPYLRIENFFSKVELEQLIFPELEYYTLGGKLEGVEKTGSARDREGKVVKKNSGCFIEQLYRESSSSAICRGFAQLAFADPRRRYCRSSKG